MGGTVIESIVKEISFIAPFYISGQECENLMFLSLHGAAIGVDKSEMISVVITYLKENADDYDRMKKGIVSIKELIDKDGIKKLVEMMDINK